MNAVQPLEIGLYSLIVVDNQGLIYTFPSQRGQAGVLHTAFNVPVYTSCPGLTGSPLT